jgi:DNA invertase Pin-like site-specific DNA recombinase
MRAAIYLRITEDEDPQVTKIRLQDLQALVATNGWETVHIYRDVVPAVKKDRPAFRTMQQDAQQHHFDVLLFWSLSQLQHGTRDTALLLNQLSTWGISFCSCTEPHINTCHAHKNIVIAIFASLAQQDHAYISERTRAGLKRQKRMKHPGPNGYIGPGRPSVQFNQARARALRAKNKFYAQIAEACGISKATVQRFFKQAS